MGLDYQLIKNTKGFLDEKEGGKLYEIAKCAARLGPLLEIGGYCGKSTIYLGTACRESGSVLFSIDHHRGSEEQQPGEEYFDPELYDIENRRVDTFREFRNTLEKAGLQDTVIPIVAKSETVAKFWKTPLALVFIDGGHTFPAAFTDYNCWATHIVPSGYLLIHDIFKDPQEGGQAPYHIYKLALSSGLFKDLPMVKTLGIFQRRKEIELPENLPV